MPPIRVRRLNYSAQYAYAPPTEDAVVNSDAIISVVPTEARGAGPFVEIHLAGGGKMVCRGVPQDFAPDLVRIQSERDALLGLVTRHDGRNWWAMVGTEHRPGDCLSEFTSVWQSHDSKAEAEAAALKAAEAAR